MYSSSSTALVVICVVFLVLASVFVALRFKVRATTKTGIGADDYLILLALVCILVACVFGATGIRANSIQLTQYAAGATAIYSAVAAGVGDSELGLAMHPAEAERNAKLNFEGPLVFAASITLIKLSILILYQRIFITRGFRFACYIVMGLTIAWFLASVFGNVFSSNPVSNAWKHPNHFVINYSAFLLSVAAINTALDLTIVVLPLFVIRSLQMSPKRKMLVGGIFLLGTFCIVASIVRLYYFVKLSQRANTSIITEDDIWSFIEPQMSIIAACLPTLASLFRDGRDPASMIRSVRSFLSLRSTSSLKERNGTISSKSRSREELKQAKNAWKQLNSNPTHLNDATHREDSMELDEMRSPLRPSDAIVVQKSFRNEVELV